MSEKAVLLKSIVCLANSRKFNNRCIAGKDTTTYEWIRPVSSREKHELTFNDIAYDNGEIPQLLDIIQIPFEQREPIFCQPENILISSGKWKKLGEYPTEKLIDLCDNPNKIWINEYYNDRITVDYIKNNGIESSLFLIKPESVTLIRENYTGNWGIKKKIRVKFTYNGERYNLRLTDPVIENKYNKKKVGYYELDSNNIFLCISLGEPFEGYCYKLVTSIILIE